MRKAIIGAAFAAIVGAMLVLPGVAFAGDPFQQEAAHQLAASACGPGTMVINAVESVTNDVDSGQQGNNWAYDNYQRNIKVWQVGSDTYCATVTYTGKFTTVEGPAPGPEGPVAAGIIGTMNGGYRSTIFTGTLNENPVWATRGNVGTVNYACTIEGACHYVSWLDVYFSSTSNFNLAWWGWIYNAGPHGTWTNAITGNTGNIQ